MSEEKNKYFNFDEFLDFIFAVYGENPEIKCKASSTIDSSSDVSDSILIDKVYNSLKEHTSEISQKVISTQNINIVCGDDKTKVDPMYLEYRDTYNTFFGNKTDSEGCVTGGCCPSIHQVSKIRLGALQRTAVKETAQIVNGIVSEIEQSMNLQVGCSQIKKEKESNIKVSSASENLATNRAQELIEREINMDMSAGQNITIHMKYPALCSNKCGEEPSSSPITQVINIRVLASNIVSTVKETIDVSNIESKTKSEVSFGVDKGASFDTFKGYIYSVLTVFVSVLIYVIYIYLAYLVQGFLLFYLSRGNVMDIDGVFPKWSRHAIALLLIYITIKIWNFIICVFYLGDGFFYCLMGMTWTEYIKEWTEYIVCKVKQFIRWVVEIVMDQLGPVGAIGQGLFDAVDITATAGGAILSGEDPVDAVKDRNKCASDEEIINAISDALEQIFGGDRKCEAV